MVSFSCEGCGDVLTKKKLDAHHRQCQGSTFTCLDCMTHFRGTDYRSHTSCVSEEQKYQGALYKEKPTKKSSKTSESKRRPRSAYIEDAPDVDNATAITIVDPPPAAPSPPTARHSQPAKPVNVFDFLVAGDTPEATPYATPNASKVSLGGSNESMTMVEHAPKVFASGHLHDSDGDDDEPPTDDTYEKKGYTYGKEPVPVIPEQPVIEYITPVSKHRRNDSNSSLHNPHDSQQKSTDRKRKRITVEELDLTASRHSSQAPEVVMADADVDAPPAILHSGLTGGLNRLLSKSKFPPSPDYTNEDPSPPSPVKRSKRVIRDAKGEGIARGRNGALVKVRKRRSSDESRPRKRRSSDESRPRKHHRSHHSPERPKSRTKQRAIEDRPQRKAIELHPPSHHNGDDSQQLVVYKSRAELFMSFVTKGPDSEQGYSLHKALKRYHRERGELGLGVGKVEEEKELFRNLRLRRNERGEVVVFF